ncbi:MAG: type I DNA topoisomerase [Bacteroidia bacterium]|nr:type I DNA topoisomerase [Bacteroidia bacterium]MDG2042262.1 type I DNA topoisomerase [Bacteroidia bacterium]|tara:strand:- start:20907 stop:23225 length:2319 start_codon:yes stop_codon:yes gene_type:complete
MSKNLVIVESPAKAKTIEKFLGDGFTVKSSFGHIRDLAKGDSAIDIEKGYLPNYTISTDKKKIVTELKKLAKDADMVWLASDEDREGEAISWHLSEVLGLKPDNTKRIVFHEITKSAILHAIDNPRDINNNLVKAQQARRVLDRLVGFQLSPVLWRKVKPSLSAGRVQSVAVRLIVEREKQIEDFVSSSSFKMQGSFSASGKSIRADLSKRPPSLEDANAFLTSCKGAEFKVGTIKTVPAKRYPSAPFTTSTLQQEASRKLGYNVSRTMMLAQRLYENGHITYMRTDSVNLSDFARKSAQQTITQEFGDSYSNPRKYSTKSDSAQEAHEAIRPTNFDKNIAGDDDAQRRLYQLIWKRAIASQMSDAQLERTTIDIVNSNNSDIFKAKGEVIKFDGFLKVYLEGSDDENEEEDSGLLPQVTEGQSLDLIEIKATQRYTRPPARFTEASLVKRLEELGIGRPSTYAPTISTVQKRGYVVKDEIEGKSRSYDVLILKDNQIDKEKLTENYGADKNKLHPSDIGRVVTEFLIEHFSEIMDFGFTASVEKEFDEIAEGMKNWSQMIDDFYQPFSKNVTKTLENAGRATGERALGNDPKTGKPIIARIGRFGPMVQIGEQNDEERPRFASLSKGQNINNITLEEAVDLFKMPRILGTYEDKDVKANIGRFGPYVQHLKMFVSIPKDEDVMTIELDRAIELIEAKKIADANRIIKKFDKDPDTEILNGRWGPYIKSGKKNFKLPKDLEDPSKLTLEEVKYIMENQPIKGKRKVKKTTKK